MSDKSGAEKHADKKSAEMSAEVEKAVADCCEKVGTGVSDAKFASGPITASSFSVWGVVLLEMLKKFGLAAVASSLPELRKKLEAWQPTGGLMKLVRKQLIYLIDSLGNEYGLEETTELDESMFAMPPKFGFANPTA